MRALREKARVLYEGNEVPHRSCGVALAETFARDPRPYLTLRRGGLTGEGLCGAVLAGQMVLGELLGGDDFTAAAPAALRDARATAGRSPSASARATPRRSSATISSARS